MTEERVQEQLAIIREMVDKSRRETAESGSFFIWIGVIAMLAVLAIRGVEVLHLSHLLMPVLLGMIAANAVVGYTAVARRKSRARVRSYPAMICYSVWGACAVPMILVAIVLPSLDAYDWSLSPVLGALFMGVGAFATGAIFEVRAIRWSSLAWWGAAVAMTALEGWPKALVMEAALLVGLIFPGIVLNRRYRRERGGDES